MFDQEVTAGILLFIFALLINRLLAERALARLTAEEKGELLEAFSSSRIYGTVSVAVALIIFVLVTQAMPVWRFELAVLFIVAIGTSQILQTIWSFMKLKRLAVPRHYLNNFALRCVIYYLALAVLVLSLIRQYLKT